MATVTKLFADKIISAMPKDMVIHRYDARKTNSVYLKFDYGFGWTLRISDHNGKEHLSYKYNLLIFDDNLHVDENGFDGVDSYYFNKNQVDLCIAMIIKNYQERKKQICDYDSYLAEVKRKIDFFRGFWNGAREVRMSERKNGEEKTKNDWRSEYWE